MSPLAASVAAAFLSLPSPPPASPAAMLTPPAFRGGGDGGVAGGAATLHVHGRIAYSRTVESSPSLVGAARVRVELWDQDDFGDELMATVETDFQGFFDVTFEWDDCDFTGCDDPDLYLVFRTINDEHDVQRDSFLQTTWAWSTEDDVLDDVTATEIDVGTLTPAAADEQGAVHVHTVLSFARDVLEPTGIGVLFPQLECDWSATSTDTELDGTRLSLSGADGWSEATVGREYLLFFFEEKYNTPLGNLCNGICDDDGCDACLWCIEAPDAAWRLGCSIWFGDALGRWMTATTGAPPLDSVPEIDAIFPCPDGLPVEPAWVPGYVAAILRDLEDNVELLDVDGDGQDDAPPETACERDSLSRGIEDVVFDVFFTEHADVDAFVAFQQAEPFNSSALWRTLRRIAGDRWTSPDLAPPLITSATSSSHPGGIGQSPVAEVFLFAADGASGVAAWSYVWSPTQVTVDTTVDTIAPPTGPTALTSPMIPYGSELTLWVRAVDCAGNWSQTIGIGPFRVADCDEDGVPDFCACGGCDAWPGYCPPETCGTVLDCNGNLVPDDCDFVSGSLADCNLDGIADECQAPTNTFDPNVPPGVTASWNVANSWDNGALPTASELACLRLGSTAYVTRLEGAPANVFAFGCDHTLELVSTLTAAASSRTQRLDLLGGTITGTGHLTAGELFWTSGTVSASAGSDPEMLVGSLRTIGTTSKDLRRDTTVVTGLQHQAGALAMSAGADLLLGSGSVSTIAGGATMFWSFGALPTLTVDGELRKVGPGLSQIQQIPLFLDGTVAVDEGQLAIAHCTMNGSAEIAAGATLRLADGTVTMGQGASISGGRLEITSGTKTLDGVIDVDESLLSGGTISLLPSLDWTSDALTMSNGSIIGAGDMTSTSFLWTGGSIGGSGTASTTAATFGTSGQKNLQRTLAITDEATYTGTGMAISENGRIDIASGATFTIAGDGGFTWISGSQPGSLVNGGVLRKAGSAGISNVTFIGLTNHGLVAAETGTLRFNCPSTHDGSLLGAAGTTLEFTGGTHTFGGGSTIDASTFRLVSGTVSVAGGFTSDMLEVSNGTLQLDASATVETDSMLLAGGTVTGPADMLVHGPLEWLAGSMQGTGTTTLASPATASGASQKTLRRSLTVADSFLLASGSLGVDAGGLLEVAPGAELGLGSGASLSWINGPTPGTALVRGRLRKTADSGLATVSFVPLTVEGEIVIDAGILQLTSPTLVSGDISSAPGAELRFAGSNQQVIGPGGTVDVGTLRLVGSATILNAPTEADATILEAGITNVNGSLSTGTLNVTGGTLGGIGAVTASGAATISSITAQGTGTLDLLGPTSLQGTQTKSLLRTVRLGGATTWTGGIIGLSVSSGGSGLLHIRPGASLDVAASNLGFTWIVGTAPGSVLNEGTIRSLAGTGTTSVSFIGLTNAGTLDLAGTRWTHSGGSSYLQTAGSTIVRQGAEFEHPGSISIAGGSLVGSGLVDANVTVGAAVVSPGDATGTMTIEGTAAFAAASTLELSIASSVQDRLAVLGAATLAGSVRVSLDGGFVPAIGDSFVVLTCTSRSGTFGTVVAATPLPPDRRWALQHNPTNVTLVVVPSLPCAGDLDLDGSVGPTDLALLLGAWGTDGLPGGADLTEDGIVSAPDLAILLGAWGPCPTAAPEDGAGGVAVATGDRAPTTGAAQDGTASRPARPRNAKRPPPTGDRDDERHAGLAGLTPTVIDGDLTLPADALLEREILLLVTDDDEGSGCAIDASLLVIDGEATLEGTIRLTLDDAADLDGIACIRIAIATSVRGSPRAELVHHGVTVPVDVVLENGAVELHLLPG